MADTQEPEAPALTGNETASDIKTDYSRETSRYVTSYLNRDHALIKKLLLQGIGSGASGSGGGSGLGRIVSGLDFALGRAYGAPGAGGLFLFLPNADYVIGGETITLDDVAGFVMVAVPPNMNAPGKFVYLSKTQEGGVEVLPENCLAPVAGKPPANPSGLPCLGQVVTDGEGVVSLEPLYADELMAPNKLLILHRLLQSQVETLSGGGGGGEPGTGGAARADLLPWSADELEVMTTAKVEELIDALRAELKDYVDSGRTKTMQTDNDHFVSALMSLAASLDRLSPEVTDLLELAMVNVGFSGHSRSGLFSDPAINGTTNKLRFTTMTVSVPERTLKPGS